MKMQSFNIFETGGRQKFLKKKKEKKVKAQTQTKQQTSVLMIQKNIRRFLQYRKAFDRFQDKMQLQGEVQNTKQKDALKYWLLTAYHIRKHSSQARIIQFWREYVFSRNQVQFQRTFLFRRMIGLTIQFTPQIIQLELTQSVRILQLMVGMIGKSQLRISKSQVRTIWSAFNNKNDVQAIQNLRSQFIMALLNNQQARQIGSQIFQDQDQLLEYLIVQNRNVSLNQSGFVRIQQLIVTCYPGILLARNQTRQISGQGRLSPNKFNQVCSIYTSTLTYLQKEKSNISAQNTLLMMAFMNILAQKMKQSTIDRITTTYKINSKFFGSQTQNQDYLQEKDEYYIFREIIMGNYEHSKQFLKKTLKIIMQTKQNQISQLEQIIQRQAIQYAFQLINIFGDSVQVVPMNEAIDFLFKNINQSQIHNIGKEKSFFSKESDFTTMEQKIALLLTIACKASQETPDLYFIKFYQQAEDKQKLKKLIKQYLLKILKHTIFLPKTTVLITKITKITISLLQNLYNKIFRTSVLNTQIFENTSIILKLKNFEYKSSKKDQVSLFLTQFPYIFPLHLRALKLREILAQQRHSYQHYGHGNYWDDSDGQDNLLHNGNVRIRRNYEFIDAFQQMRKGDLRKHFKITFINQFGLQERGIDAGGLKKQFLNRVLKAVLNPNYGMFIQNQGHQLLPHPIKAQLKEGIETEYYEFIGKLIGLAIYENITLGYKFSGTFLNAIVGKKNCFDDLKKIEPHLYKSLIYIKDMQQDARDLCLTFMYKDQIRNKHIQLIPNGHLTQVTNQNKRLYISQLATYKVNKLLDHQTRFIRKGLTSIINKEWLFMFNYEELNYLISGQGQIDVEDLRSNTKVVGFQPGSQTMGYFWEVVSQFNQQQKSKLLMFVTACPRPSFLGFKQLRPPFTIVKNKRDCDTLPMSHTCSNLLELPDYKNKQLLKKKLLTAIESNAGFEFG